MEELEIEIVDFNPIEGGVQVFARAWKNGEQIGFGVDGTVDIERFRIFNPPVLVDDPDGDITQVIRGDDTLGIPEHVRTLREDPEEAILRSLESTILTMKNAFDSSKIEAGKRGNTTSTIYSSTADGTFLSDNKATYALARDATASDSIDQGNGNLIHNSKISTTYYVRRYIAYFDTSVIGSDTISSATYSVASLGTSTSADSDSVDLVSFSGSNPPVVGDFDLFGTTSWGNKTFASFSTTVGVYNDIALNATGISNINKSGTTAIGARSTKDIANTTPTGTNIMRVYQADNAGTASDPKLVVEHAAGGATFTPRIIMY